MCDAVVPAEGCENWCGALEKAKDSAGAGRNGGALKLYFKVEFLDTESRKILRPIAWISFLTGDYETSRRYYDKVLADGPLPTDMINIAHLEMATPHYP